MAPRPPSDSTSELYGVPVSVPEVPSLDLIQLEPLTTRRWDPRWLEALFGRSAVELLGEDQLGGSPEGAEALRATMRQIFRLAPGAIEELARNTRPAAAIAARWNESVHAVGGMALEVVLPENMEALAEALRSLCREAIAAGEAVLVFVQ